MGYVIGIRNVKFGDTTSRQVVIKEVYGYRLRDGRPLNIVDENTYEYVPL